MQVHEVMTSTVWAAEADTPIAAAARLMARSGLTALPVIAGARLLGLVTAQELARRAPEAPVSAVMRQNLPACPASRRVIDALHDMEQSQLAQLPVEDDQARLVGMISLADARAACHRNNPLATARDAASGEPDNGGIRIPGRQPEPTVAS